VEGGSSVSNQSLERANERGLGARGEYGPREKNRLGPAIFSSPGNESLNRAFRGADGVRCASIFSIDSYLGRKTGRRTSSCFAAAETQISGAAI